jgi:hypothetical protein
MELIPYRASHRLLAARPVGRTDFPEIPFPSTVSLELAPCEVARQLHLGSALRLSLPLSGFLAGSSFAALFRAATVPGIPPFRVFPSQEIAYPSRGNLASLQLSTAVQERTARGLLPFGFPDVHAFTRLPGSPGGYELPFHSPG